MVRRLTPTEKKKGEQSQRAGHIASASPDAPAPMTLCGTVMVSPRRNNGLRSVVRIVNAGEGCFQIGQHSIWGFLRSVTPPGRPGCDASPTLTPRNPYRLDRH